MKLLIDADFTVYKCCAAAETEIDFGDDVIVVTSKFSEAYARQAREARWRLDCTRISIDLSMIPWTHSTQFRVPARRAKMKNGMRGQPYLPRRRLEVLLVFMVRLFIHLPEHYHH